MTTILDGRYQIIKKLGHGGFAHTYLARNLTLPDRPPCVIKHLKPRVFHPSVVYFFHTEARILGQLRHGRIPRSSDCFERDGEVFMVQEFIDGEDLGKQFLRGRQWSESEIRSLLMDVLEILDYLHQHQIVHRDIKPDNIMQRGQDGRHVLIDFGAVRELNQDDQLATDPQAISAIVGTVGYRPPEQLQGETVCSSDLYGLGVTAIQLLTRTHPSYLEQCYGKFLWRDRAQVSYMLGAIIDKMVCPDLQERYCSAAAALEDLRQLPSPQEPSEWLPVATSRPRAPKAVQKRWPLLAIASFLLVATAGIAGMQCRACWMPNAPNSPGQGMR